MVSKQHFIYNVEMGYEPFNIDIIDGDKIVFRYATPTKEPSLFYAHDRNLLYSIQKDSLIVMADVPIQE